MDDRPRPDASPSPLATPRRRQFRRRPVPHVAIVAAVAVLLATRLWFSPEPLDPHVQLEPGPHVVVRVVDGDTIIVAPSERVRLIGVDTPETVKPEHEVEPFGPEASEFTKDFLAGGTARLAFDREQTDRFGRHLAYVWVGERMLNEELLRAGLGRFEPELSLQPCHEEQVSPRSTKRRRITAASGQPCRRDRSSRSRQRGLPKARSGRGHYNSRYSRMAVKPPST